ncbi:MAG: C1 family peptidase [Acholeplasmatales bacterium]|nr:C1 family peptidase [Acholeplasmatales bacterium]
MANIKEITYDFLNDELAVYNEKIAHHITRHALSHTSIDDFSKTLDNASKIDYSFNVEVKTMPVTNQKASGRCWIFAATNVLREIIAKKLNLDNFELSQSYIGMYDKLEKINFELEAIIDLKDKDADDRTLTYVLLNTISDGGQWDMFIDIVTKYGIVPKNVFPETYTSSNTRGLNHLVSVTLEKFASDIKELDKKGGMELIRAEKDKLFKKLYHLIISTYGIAPKTFDFEYVDANKVYHKEEGFTPLSFFEKYVKSEALSYVSLINAPTKDKPFNHTFTVEYLGNVVGGKGVKHLNLEMERIKELIINQLKDGNIVWFGSDVSFYRDRASYAWDDRSFDYQTPFGISYYADKAKALDYHISQMNHAMCITGVCLDNNGKALKWKIENSWGDDIAKKGYFAMSDTWFDEYVYQAVIDKKYLSYEELDAYENSKPISLKPWDPMGSLAD